MESNASATASIIESSCKCWIRSSFLGLIVVFLKREGAKSLLSLAQARSEWKGKSLLLTTDDSIKGRRSRLSEQDWFLYCWFRCREMYSLLRTLALENFSLTSSYILWSSFFLSSQEVENSLYELGVLAFTPWCKGTITKTWHWGIKRNLFYSLPFTRSQAKVITNFHKK